MNLTEYTNMRWSKEEDDILIKLYGNTKPELIYKQLPNRSVYSIRKRANILELKGNMRLSKKKYTIDFHYFKQITADNSYWAGFIAADGCVCNKDSSVRISLSEKDRHHLEIFCKSIGYDGPIIDYKQKQASGNVFNYSRVGLWGVREWCHDLGSNFNIIDRKSLVLKPPTNLTRIQYLNFIIGYIDGDGSIFFDKKGKIHLGLVGTREMMAWIHYILGQEHANRVNFYKRNNVYRLVYTGSTAASILQILSNTTCNFRLERKWSKIQKIA